MKIEPVKNYKTPAYPTIERYVYNPREFLRHTPYSWFGNAAVWTALVAFSVGGNSCKSGKSEKLDPEIVDSSEKNVQQKQIFEVKKSHVAPIFVHGDGIGSFGCMVTTPPVILSEEDALQIIKAELAKHNLILDSTNQSVQIPVNKIDAVNDTIPNVIKEKNLKFDGEIKNINFLIEYLSSDDYHNFEDDNYEIDENGKVTIWCSSVSYIKTKQMATSIREKILKDNKHNAVVLYDPVVCVDWDKIKTKKGQKESKKLLIQQVTDFIEWLKKEKLLTEN